MTFSKKDVLTWAVLLKWNSVEHSWDCPCHGSRFSEKGEILDNPANKNLEQP